MPSVDCGIVPRSQPKAPTHVMEKLGGLQSAIHELKCEEQKSDFQKIDQKLQVNIQDCKSINQNSNSWFFFSNRMYSKFRNSKLLSLQTHLFKTCYGFFHVLELQKIWLRIFCNFLSDCVHKYQMSDVYSNMKIFPLFASWQISSKIMRVKCLNFYVWLYMESELQDMSLGWRN